MHLGIRSRLVCHDPGKSFTDYYNHAITFSKYHAILMSCHSDDVKNCFLKSKAHGQRNGHYFNLEMG